MTPPLHSNPQRMRFGCCGSTIAPGTDPVGVGIAEELASLGFDYIELSVRDLVALPAAEFDRVVDRLRRTGLAGEACNNFFPPEIRLTGPKVDLPSVLQYAQTAFATAARLGASVIVFGSSGARNVPEGFPVDAAWSQLRTLLRQLGPMAEKHGITLALEHLNREESNILNTVAESWRMAQEVAHPRVRLLVDAYHLLRENEDPAILTAVASAVVHVHVAQGRDRVFPSGADGAVTNVFARLRAAGYAQRCSIEAFTQDFSADAARALRVCREIVSGTARLIPAGSTPPATDP